MNQYLDLMHKVRNQGKFKKNRTGIGVLSIFGYQMRFNLKYGFPLITTKKCSFSIIIHELLWFLQGNTNISYLNQNNVHIWDKWADKDGNLGPIYGHQWRFWETKENKKIDQLDKIINQLKNDPNSRRIIVSSWNVGELDKMALEPCHVLFQFYVVNKLLSCQIYQRSCDIFLGVPFNIASYALLMFMVAQQCDLKIGELIWTGGDIHLYLNHIKQADLQLTRKPFPLPKLSIIGKPESLFHYSITNFKLNNYRFHPKITASVAV